MKTAVMKESQSMTGYSDVQIGFEGFARDLLMLTALSAEGCQDNELMNDDDNECRAICMYTRGCVDEQGDNDNNAKTMKNDAR